MTAISGERTFAYHGVETSMPYVNGALAMSPKASHTEEVKLLIKTFLEGVKFDRSSPFIKDRDLEAAVWQYFKDLKMGDDIEKWVQKPLKLSVTLAHQAYTTLPFEIRALCAIQFLYMFLVDDSAEEFMEELKSFSKNFVLKQPHGHPLLDGFDSHLRHLSKFYGPYCYSAILKSLFDYINGRIIEHRMEQASFQFGSHTRLMPMFLRTKVGGAEILIHLLWPKEQFPEEEYVMQYFPATQELVLFIDFTNDILSYYKEFVLRDEKGNFVANFADTHQMSHLDVLRHLTSYTPGVIQSVYEMFEKSPELLLSVQNFATGWIMLCTAHRRYHLVELFEEEQYLPPYDEDS